MTENEFANTVINISVGAVVLVLAVAIIYKIYCLLEIWWDGKTAEEQGQFGLKVLLFVLFWGFVGLSYFVGAAITTILSGA
jgi:hypothetical protein